MAEINSTRKCFIPSYLLDDLSSRFIINVPQEERADLTRLCFQIELAHWFYLDFYCEENPKLPKCNVRDFIHIIFRHIPFLQQYYSEIESVISDWREYKSAVPTYGAILLDMELKKVLLVQSFYSKASWGFPKGKVNEDEKPHHCAIREVYEETGFDITNYIKKDDFLEHYFNEQLIRLYIITGIPPDAKFEPKTRKEIKSVDWFTVNQLPTGKKDEASRNKLGPNNFFMVIPFVKQLQKWIAANPTAGKSGHSAHDQELDAYLKQQRIFSQLTKKDLEKYMTVPENESKTIRSERSKYSPPPRMLRQRNAKLNEKRKPPSNNFQEERIIINSSLKKNFEGSKEEKKKVPSNLTDERKKSIGTLRDDKEVTGNRILPCAAWSNVSLDCEALVASFNINLRKYSELCKFPTTTY